MSEKKSNSIGTIILLLIAIPVIAYLLNFAHKKNSESEERATQCQTECTESGYRGHEFKWNIFSGPQCNCFGND